MSKSADLKVNVSADTTKAVSALDKLAKELEGLTSIKGTGKAASVLIWVQAAEKAYQVAKKLYDTGKKLVDVYAVQERAETRLAAALRTTGNQIGLANSELMEMAQNFQKTTRFGSATVLELQQLFITSGRLTREQLPQVISLSLDMAEALGTDATSAARTLSKVLADPIKGIATLSSQNVFFTQSERDKITQLAETNQTLEAQQLILDKIASAYGGIAQELANTDTGKIDQIKNLMTDIKSGLGQGIIVSLSPALDFLIEKLAEIVRWVNAVNASKTLLDDLKGGVNIGMTYTPDSILHVMTTVQKRQDELEDTLNRTYIAEENWKRGRNEPKLTLEKDKGKFKAELPSYWDFNKKTREIYDEWVENKDVLAQLGVAHLVSLNPPKLPAGELFGEGDYEDTSSTKETLTLFEQILQATSATESARRKILETRIEENELLLSTLSLKEEAGDLTKEERDLAEEMLNQQVALDRLALQKLGQREEPEGLTAVDFIGKHTSLSISAQVEAIDTNLALAESFKAAAEAGSEEEKQLEEIIESLKEQRDLILDTSTASESILDTIVPVFEEFASYYLEFWNSLSSLTSQIYQNQISALQKTLDTQRDEWNRYYSDIKEKHTQERDALDAKYHWGLLSAEEYFDSLEDLQQSKITAERAAAKDEEEIAKKIDALKEKKFESEKANSIMQALIAGAVGVANIWRDWASVPVVAGILTGVTAASVAMQVATIASQKYTPLAEGGIAIAPTHALIAEAGEPELVLPLSKAQDYGFGGGGVINLTFNITPDGSLSREDMTRAIFESIEKAQRTGALPRWRMTG